VLTVRALRWVCTQIKDVLLMHCSQKGTESISEEDETFYTDLQGQGEKHA